MGRLPKIVGTIGPTGRADPRGPLGLALAITLASDRVGRKGVMVLLSRAPYRSQARRAVLGAVTGAMFRARVRSRVRAAGRLPRQGRRAMRSATVAMGEVRVLPPASWRSASR